MISAVHIGSYTLFHSEHGASKCPTRQALEVKRIGLQQEVSVGKGSTVYELRLAIVFFNETIAMMFLVAIKTLPHVPRSRHTTFS